MKKKLTRSSFSALRETATLLDEREQRAVIGGDYWDDYGIWQIDSNGNLYWTRTSEGDGGSYYGDSGYYGGSGNNGDGGNLPISEYMSNQMSWELSKISFFSEASYKFNIHLSSMNVIVSPKDRYADAWIGDNKEVFLGDAFFRLSSREQLRVLIHEYTHVTEDQFWSKEESHIQTKLPDPPPDIRSYILNEFGHQNFDLDAFLTYETLYDPQYYKNEANAYKRVKPLFTDLTYDEQQKLYYNIGITQRWPKMPTYITKNT